MQGKRSDRKRRFQFASLAVLKESQEGARRGPVVVLCLLYAPKKYSLFYQQNKFPFWPFHMYK